MHKHVAQLTHIKLLTNEIIFSLIAVTVGQSVQQTFNVGNGFQVGGLLNGGILDATQVQQQQGVVHNNLVPLGQL